MLQLHQRLALLTMGTLAYQYHTGNEMVNNPQKYNELKKFTYEIGVFLLLPIWELQAS